MKLKIDYIFDDAEGHVEGLQGKVLPKSSCALFVYDMARCRSFHMRNVPTGLWLSSFLGGECVASVEMPKGSTDVFRTANVALVCESRVEIPEGSSVEIDGDWLVVS